jgi:hypothetical protein
MYTETSMMFRTEHPTIDNILPPAAPLKSNFDPIISKTEEYPFLLIPKKVYST